MTSYCTSCGANIGNEVAACPDCGTSVESVSESWEVIAQEASKPSAPIGIKILCVVVGIITTVLTLVMAFLSVRFGVGAVFGVLGPLGIVQFILIQLFYPMIYGLWTVKAWGWKLAIGLYSFAVLSRLFEFITGTGTGTVVALVVGSAILWYIYTKRDLYLSA